MKFKKYRAWNAIYCYYFLHIFFFPYRQFIIQFSKFKLISLFIPHVNWWDVNKRTCLLSHFKNVDLIVHTRTWNLSVICTDLLKFSIFSRSQVKTISNKKFQKVLHALSKYKSNHHSILFYLMHTHACKKSLNGKNNDYILIIFF